MKSEILRNAIAVFLLIAPAEIVFSQQDTSNYFPRGIWGVYLPDDILVSPWPPRSLTTDQWNRERVNLSDVHASYINAWYPYTIHNMMLDYVDTSGYKMDISMSNYGFCDLYDYSLVRQILCLRNIPAISCNPPQPCSNMTFDQRWRDTVDARITYIRDAYSSRPGFYSYFVGHEDNFWGYDRMTSPQLLCQC